MPILSPQLVANSKLAYAQDYFNFHPLDLGFSVALHLPITQTLNLSPEQTDISQNYGHILSLPMSMLRYQLLWYESVPLKCMFKPNPVAVMLRSEALLGSD
jgi:hypothetical protein